MSVTWLRKSVSTALVVSGFLIGHHNTLSPEIINVPDDYSSMQEGISAASDGDTVLVARGSYNESLSFMGKEILLTSLYLIDQDTTHIDSTIIRHNSNQVVFFHWGEDTLSVLQGFTIRGGLKGILCTYSSPKIRKNVIKDNERGIYLYNSNAIIEDNWIEDNVSYYVPNGEEYYGAGIKCEYSDILIRRNTIAGNGIDMTGHGGGGGIAAYQSNLIVENNIIEHNGASGENWGDHPIGGGILMINCEYAIIINNIIEGNGVSGCYNGATGGGLYFLNSNVRLLGNLIMNNGASDCFDYGRGGGIFGNAEEIRDCVISGNGSNGNGGGISGTQELIENCLIINNNAGNFGGGITGRVEEMVNCTFYGNTADSGSCIHGGGNISNTIFWNNDTTQFYYSGNPPNIIYSDIEGGWVGEGNINQDPLFVDPANSDFSLMEGSICIDSGDPATQNVPWGGFRRDMGASEYDQGFYFDGQNLIKKPFLRETVHKK